MDFTKFHCPVCNKEFLENDDVVVCPECGTPHHRECYKITGKCFNENLHGTDNNLSENCKNPETLKAEKILHVNTDEKADEDTNNPFKINGKTLPDFIRVSPAQSPLIEGKHANLYEAAVGKNQKYYIPKFAFMSSLNKGISFNFVAFFAPLAWTFYRKMYKFAALIFASYVCLFGVIFYNFYSNSDIINAMNECIVEIQENPEAIDSLQMINSEEFYDELTDTQKNLVNEINKVQSPFYITILSYAITYAPKFLLGILGNRLYLKKLRKNIDDAEKKGLEGDKLKVYLYKRYGTVPFALALIVGILELIFM